MSGLDFKGKTMDPVYFETCITTLVFVWLTKKAIPINSELTALVIQVAVSIAAHRCICYS